MVFKAILDECLSLLYWTMLAATTVGPGTIVTCAEAGAEYQLHLIWTLIFASILAYTLQEGTARLTITSGKSLGECLQIKYMYGRKIWEVGILCWLVAGCVFIGNLLYECNCFAGGMMAIYSLPPASNSDMLRIGGCIAYGIIILAILFADKVHSLGISLGIVMVSVVILFLVVDIKLGIDLTRFRKGLLPISMPSGSSNIVLSLIGTTSLGFNLFLGGEMAKGKTLPATQRGIAFSTFIALMVSILILIAGDGTYKSNKGEFNMDSLAAIITYLTGNAGIWIFGIGFIAATLSSMITVPLAAALAAKSLFTINGRAEGCDDEMQPLTTSGNSVDKEEIDNQTKDSKSETIQSDEAIRPFPKKYYNGLMFVMVLISLIVTAANAPAVKVILIAQVFNGCLLPFFSICLLLCINDQQLMKMSPQKGWANCCLVTVVMITLILTTNTIIQNLFGWLVTMQHVNKLVFEISKLCAAGVTSIAFMTAIFCLTDLGSNIKNSFITCCSSD